MFQIPNNYINHICQNYVDNKTLIVEFSLLMPVIRRLQFLFPKNSIFRGWGKKFILYSFNSVCDSQLRPDQSIISYVQKENNQILYLSQIVQGVLLMRMNHLDNEIFLKSILIPPYVFATQRQRYGGGETQATNETIMIFLYTKKS